MLTMIDSKFTLSPPPLRVARDERTGGRAAVPRLVARFGGGERDHLNGGGVNIQAINVNDGGEYDASGPLIYRPPTDRVAGTAGD